MSSSIVFSCPGCNKSFTVPLDKAGKSTKCPVCGKPFRVPIVTDLESSPPKPQLNQIRARQDRTTSKILNEPREVVREVIREIVHVPVQVPIPQDDRVIRTEHTVRARGSFGSAFGGALGCMTAMALFAVLGIGVLIWGVNRILNDHAKVIEMREAANATKEKLAPRALAMSQGQTINGITVEITGIRIGKVDLEVLGKRTVSDDNALVVSLKVSTSDPNKKYDHRPWSDDSGFLSQCSLKDNNGNDYKLISYGFSANVVGAANRSVITTRSYASDVIAFEVPVEGATELELTLEADNLSNSEKFRFRIPKKLWARAN